MSVCVCGGGGGGGTYSITLVSMSHTSVLSMCPIRMVSMQITMAPGQGYVCHTDTF